MMGVIENIEIKKAQPPARVIVNARTGTVVINGAVRVGPAAVSHGKLTVKVDENPRVVQPAPFSRGDTVVQPSSDITIDEPRNPAYLWDKGASLADIVKAINKLGVSPGDLVAILEALSQAGALSGELVVI
jgi:flagellar P-ring protein FlgI